MGDHDLDRGQQEDVLRRALEIAHGRETTDQLSEGELLRIGSEVGIPRADLELALAEQRVGLLEDRRRTLIDRLVGPAVARTDSLWPADREPLRVLDARMRSTHLQQLIRIDGGSAAWTPRRGLAARAQRALGTAAGTAALPRVEQVTARVAPVGNDRQLVALDADLGPARRELTSSGLVLGIATVASAIALSVTVQAALIGLAPLGVLLGVAIARSYRRHLDRTEVELAKTMDAALRDEPVVRPVGNAVRSAVREIGRRASRDA